MLLQVIVGSVRTGRRSMPVAEWIVERMRLRQGLTVELIDLKQWALPMYDLASFPTQGDYQHPLQQRWAASVARADGYVFVSPEYNHGYSAVLKNALDYLYAEWNQKPATFVSFGNAEGARGIEQLRLVLVELAMAPLPTALHVRDIGKKLVDGRFHAEARDEQRFEVVLDELVWWADVLARARATGSPWRAA